MNRRQFLTLSAAGVTVAALGSAAWLYEDEQDYVLGLVRQYIGDFRMEQAQRKRFVDDVTARYGDLKTAMLVGLHKVRDHTGAGIDYTDERVEWFERRIVTEFITSTDYVRKQGENNPTLTYLGIHTPCTNPFARFS
ncbi:twin-arginine translocation signal domain-containing protein [Halopseudomonas nanhaiensis]|uniref:twin-arginine translocation signal domain-containing protein n=1 Tax=Halopseudomonas nanhaiensis TaxID=2830842 RepID=UPI001CBF6990|nr:twin-arginine translocation signal domain-containing protein [Halopseudomonas nanhaiensis]UAW99183.1 twin-arginine translocation signal domain-containing protein [Halopseudomonas nanhaiensis]